MVERDPNPAGHDPTPATYENSRRFLTPTHGRADSVPRDLERLRATLWVVEPDRGP